MMLNKTSAHFYTLGNNIYTKKNPPTNIYLFIVSNRNTKKRCEICSKLTIKTPERCSTVFIVNFTPFLSVSIVEFKQESVFWVPSYRFNNVKTTYCCNY